MLRAMARAVVAAPGMDAATPWARVDLVVRRLLPHVATAAAPGTRHDLLTAPGRSSAGR